MKRKEGVEKVKMDDKRIEGVRGCWEMASPCEQGQGRGREGWNPTEAGCLQCKHTSCCGELVAAPELMKSSP